MPLTDERYEYNTLEFGGDTEYSLTFVDGLDTWDARDQQIEKALDHGSYTYTEFIRPRVITFQGFVIAEDAEALAPLLDELRRAFGAKSTDLPLGFKWSGEDEKYVNCKPTRRFIPRTEDVVNGYAEFAIQLLAGDPRKHALAESVITASGLANNAGTFPAVPVWTVVGPATNPRITNDTTDFYVQIDTTVGAGQTLVVDFSEKTVMLAGTSIYNSLNTGSRWWQLEPGNNDIDFTGITGTTELAWHSAWD